MKRLWFAPVVALLILLAAMDSLSASEVVFEPGNQVRLRLLLGEEMPDDGGIERGSIILEINRQSINSIAGFRRIVGAARPGDVLAIYVYEPELDQRAIRTVRTESR